MKKSKKKINIVIIGILLLLLLSVGLKVQAIFIGGKGVGSGNINYINDNYAHVTIIATDCRWNAYGDIQLCSGERNNVDQELSGWEIDGDVTWTIDGIQTIHENTFLQIESDYFCVVGGWVSNSNMNTCNWKAEFDITSGITTTTIPNGNGNGEIPIIALLLLAGLGIIIIKGKKWLR